MGTVLSPKQQRQRRLFTLLWGATLLSPFPSSALATVAPNPSRPKTAVIVGGGPGGLAAALVLSTVQKPWSAEAADDSNSHSNSHNNCLFNKIVVVDEAPKEAYDPTRAYFFNINRRGQTFTQAVGIDLSERGTGVTEFAKFTVPADPAEVFAGTQPFSRPMSPQEQENIGTLYWIPRHELVERLPDHHLAKFHCTTVQVDGARLAHLERIRVLGMSLV